MSDAYPTPPQIFQFRGQNVIRDADLARLFDYKTGNLNKRVTENADRFGDDFAFRLTREEMDDLIFQIGTSNQHGGIRKPPMMFTEHGAVMAATLLRSEKAAKMSRFIVKTFVAARRGKLAQRAGENLPDVIPANDLMPISGTERSGLALKLDRALGNVLDAIADPTKGNTVRDETRTVALEGLNAIKAHLKKQDVLNDKTLAEVQKLLKEAEDLGANIAARHIENSHRELALQAKQLRIVLTAQRYLDQGDLESLLTVLKDIGG